MSERAGEDVSALTPMLTERTTYWALDVRSCAVCGERIYTTKKLLTMGLYCHDLPPEDGHDAEP